MGDNGSVFVQIVSHDGQLFALDRNGSVWVYNPNITDWEAFPNA